MSRFSQHVRNSGVMFAQSVVQRMVGVLTTIVLARMLGAGGFGAYSAVINTASSAHGLVRLGVDAALNVHVAGHHSDVSARKSKGQMLGAGFLLLLLAALAGSALCLLFSERLANAVYGRGELSPLLLLASAFVFLQCLSQYCFATLVGLKRFGGYARITTLSALISVIAVTVGSILAATWGAILANICIQTLTLIVLGFLTARTLREENIILEWSLFKVWSFRLLKLGLPFYLAGLLAIPTIYFLQGLVSRYEGVEALGYLRVIISISALVAFLPTSIATPMLVKLTQSRALDERLFASDTVRHLKLIWLFTLFTAAGTVSVLPSLLPFLFGGDYLPAVDAGTIAMFSTVFASVLGVLTNACLASSSLSDLTWNLS